MRLVNVTRIIRLVLFGALLGLHESLARADLGSPDQGLAEVGVVLGLWATSFGYETLRGWDEL